MSSGLAEGLPDEFKHDFEDNLNEVPKIRFAKQGFQHFHPRNSVRSDDRECYKTRKPPLIERLLSSLFAFEDSRKTLQNG